jgi:hypothetical protein
VQHADPTAAAAAAIGDRMQAHLQINNFDFDLQSLESKVLLQQRASTPNLSRQFSQVFLIEFMAVGAR